MSFAEFSSWDLIEDLSGFPKDSCDPDNSYWKEQHLVACLTFLHDKLQRQLYKYTMQQNAAALHHYASCISPGFF